MELVSLILADFLLYPIDILAGLLWIDTLSRHVHCNWCAAIFITSTYTLYSSANDIFIINVKLVKESLFHVDLFLVRDNFDIGS